MPGPLPAVPQVLKCILKGDSGEATPLPWANVLHFQYAGTAPSSGVLSNLCTDVGGLWVSHVAPLVHTNGTLDTIELIDLTSSSSASFELATSSPGTRAGTMLTAQNAVLVNYPVSTRYRGGHPRSYVFAGVEGDLLDAAHWTSAFVTTFNTAWKAFLDGVAALTNSGTSLGSPVAVSYYSKPLNPTPPHERTVPVVYAINTAIMATSAQVGTQRRRVGRHRR